MKIAFVSTMAAAPWGGSEELWSRTALAALAQNHEVFVSVNDHRPPTATVEQLRVQGAQLHLRPFYAWSVWEKLLRRGKTMVGIVQPLETALQTFRPDVICVSQGGNFDVAHMGALRNYLQACGIPYCLLCHNYNPNHLPSTAERKVLREVFRKAAQVFFVSGDQAEVSQRQLACVLTNAAVVKNPVNLANIQRLAWPQNPVPQLAIVAGLDIDRKGHDIALAVLSQERWQLRDWHLNIYGDGQDRAYIEELLTLYNLKARVTLHGNIADIAGIWAQNHWLLMPSRREAAPLVIVEAMLCGRPVIATAVGTVAEWVTPGENGFVALAPTIPLFDEALEQAWSCQPTWAEMGTQAYIWARNNADPAAAETFLGLLMQLVTPRR